MRLLGARTARPGLAAARFSTTTAPSSSSATTEGIRRSPPISMMWVLPSVSRPAATQNVVPMSIASAHGASDAAHRLAPERGSAGRCSDAVAARPRRGVRAGAALSRRVQPP